MSIGDFAAAGPAEDYVKKVQEAPEEFLERVFGALLAYDLDNQNSFVAALKDRLATHRARVSEKLRREAGVLVIEADSVDDTARELKRM